MQIDSSVHVIQTGTNIIIGERVQIRTFAKKGSQLTLQIGENVRIGDGVQIIADGPIILKDNVTLHNHVSILGPGPCTIGKNSWIAQYTVLDTTGGLEIGEDCCIGYNCQIWSHLQRVPQIPNMKFPNSRKKTVLKNRVWLMGGLITVSPGVTIENDCIVFSNSVVSHSTEPNKVYAGIPAKVVDKYNDPQ